MLTAVLAYLEGSVTVVTQDHDTILLSDGTKVNINEFHKVASTTTELIERRVQMITQHQKPVYAQPAQTMDAFKVSPPTGSATPTPPEAIPTPENAAHSHLILGFGKHRESKLSGIQATDPKWVSWMFSNCKLKAENGRLLVINP